MKYKAIFGIIVMMAIIPTFCFAASPIEGMNNWIEHQLSANNASLAAYVFLFLGGILASLLPCTYPLYPITVNILKSRSEGSKRFLHPAFYFLGIASMYFIFGIVASVTGGAFNTILHLPLTNLVIAIAIFLLGLSSLDLLLLPIFSGASGEAKTKGVLGTFLMGMGAGLLSSACVGPVVVSILVGIASASSGFSLLSGLTAASKMLLFGVGVGLPFLLIGVFGMSLPKSGKWMKYVQIALGALIVYFSYVYLTKALLGYGFSEEAIQLVAYGSGILIIAVYFFQPTDLPPHLKMKKSLLILTGVIGILVLFRAFVPQATQANPSTASLVTDNSPKTEQKGELTWYLDKAAAYAAAKERNKPVFIDFHGDWCTNCKEFQKTTQTNAALNAALKGAVLLKMYDGTLPFNKYAADPRFPELKVGLPFFIITDKDENLLYKTNDYLKTDEMMMFLTN